MRSGRLLWYFALVLLVPTPAFAQTGTISGTVTDEATGTPLPGATVLIVSTGQGASTDIEGRYTLSGVTPGTYELNATYVGYTEMVQEGIVVRAGETTEIDFALTEETVGLEEVMVVGYGTQRSEDVTGSVASIDMEAIEAMPIISPDEALQGQIAGVNVLESTGIPGGGPHIQIRGPGNVGAGGQPLYVVDGFALPQSDDAETLERNPLASIPPEDIESMTVLKDASATAIYGSRASNGVVIITTKSGRAGALDVNVSASTGMSELLDQMMFDPATAREFALFQNRIWSGRVAAGEANEIPEQWRNPEQYGEGTNWLEATTRTAREHDVQVSVSGGSDRLRSYFSAGYTREEGLMLNTDFNRVTLRANLETDLSDRITAGLRIAPTYSVRNLNWEGGDGRDGAGGARWMTCPNAPVFMEDGSYLPQPGAEGYGEDGQLGYCPGVWSQPNPVLWLEQEDDTQDALRTLANAYVNVGVVPGLALNQSLNVDYLTSERTTFRPSTIGAGNRQPPPSIPTGSFLSGTYVNWLSETTLNWADELGPGNLDAIAGFTAQHQINQSSNFSGEFPNDDIRTLNVASNLDGFTDESEWSLLSFLARANYSLLDRYVFTGTIRSDGSSRFGEQTRWGTFPSGAVAWNLHNEPFMEGVRASIPELRMRFSYGVTGNNQIGNYSSLGTVTDADYLFGGGIASGRILSSMGNPFLAWEKTREFNFGLDAALYDYRLMLALDLYQSYTTNLLLDRDLPALAGFGEVTQNLGELRNRGLELSLSAVNVSRDNYTWTTDFNLAFNQNEIASLPGGIDINYGGAGPARYLNRVGLPMATYIGYLVDGLYTLENIDTAPSNYSGVVPGAMIFRDLNGDGVLTEDIVQPAGDFAVLGDYWPDFTFGLTNSVSVGRFDLRVLLTGTFGGDNLRAEFFRTARNIDGLFIVDSDYVHNMWVSPEQPGDGLTPTVLGGAFGRQQYRDSNHSLVLSDASHIWVRNVMLRYQLPPGLAGIRGASIYLSGSNLFLITPYPGNPNVTDMDEANQQPGMDFGNYPIPRSVTLGIDLSF